MWGQRGAVGVTKLSVASAALAISCGCKTERDGSNSARHGFSFPCTKSLSSIAETINRVKIAEAKNLIRSGTSNFSEIAAMLCYSDQHYFSRVFRRITGMSPSEYRRSVQI